MSWEDTLKADKEIKEEIQKVIDYLDLTTFFGGKDSSIDKDIETAMTMLEKIKQRFD